MPNQDPQNPNQNPQPQDINGSAIPFTPQTDLPPLPPDFQNIQTEETKKSEAPVTNVVVQEGSAAPPPPGISNITPSPKKKFGTGKVIATILGILVLVGGVGAGIALTGQKQLFQQKAVYPECANLGSHQCVGNVVSGDCFQGGQNNDYACYNLKGNPGIIVPDENCTCPSGYTWKNYEYGKWWCFDTSKICDGVDPYAVRCSTTPQQCNTPPEEPSEPTTVPTAPSCSKITTYDSQWNKIGPANRGSIKTGDTIYLCINGTAPSGTFDKARFTINGVQQTATTTMRPDSTDFCQSYTIPVGTAKFTISGQIHHSVAGWL